MDNLTKAQRSYCMSRVRTVDTDLESRVRTGLHRRDLRFRKHLRSLPRSPDIVFGTEKVAVFVDGDFWHGYRFPVWKHTLSPFWQEKIDRNRSRDGRNFARLRRQGWLVIRTWQRDVKRNLDRCLDEVESGVRRRRER
jgi:DNA mismatch endonuclease (patch repair protein)